MCPNLSPFFHDLASLPTANHRLGFPINKKYSLHVLACTFVMLVAVQ